MKWLIFVFIVLLNGAAEGLEDNCLKQNPSVLDAEANIYNKPRYSWDVTVEEIASLITLFTSRFKEAHIFARLQSWQMKQIAEGVSLFTNRTKKTVPLYLQMAPCGDDFNKTVLCLKEAFGTVTEINKNHKGVISGLYLKSEWWFYSNFLEALDVARSSFDDMKIPLSYLFPDCFPLFTSELHNLVARWDFISCNIPPNPHSSPEDSADEVIESCNQLKMTATSINITAEIRCITEYYSEGRSDNLVTGSVSSFERFWCRIVHHVLRNSEMRILMQSAFDYPPFFLGERNLELSHGKYHRGWWERVHVTSYETSAFKEKVSSILEPQNSKTTCKVNKGYIIWIFLLSTVNIVLVVVIAVGFWKTKDILKSVRLTADDIKSFKHGCPASEETQDDGLVAPYDRSYEIPKSAFEMEVSETLGMGEHGVIYRGKIKETGAMVAIKTSRNNVSSKSAKQLLSEIKIMIHVGKHPNVLSLLWANTSQKRKGIIYMLMEICDLGSLEEVLRNEKKRNEILNGLQITGVKGPNHVTCADKWALEIASGMQHIASRNVCETCVY